MTRCSAKTKDGKACKASAQKGMKTCLFHTTGLWNNQTIARGGTRRQVRKWNRRNK
jgi:hypothetical protein